MYLRSDSAAGVRFLAVVKEGRGLKPSARAAGIGKATGYRWLRESFVALRGQGFSVEAAEAELGFCSPLMLEWEKQRLARPREGRHHLAVGADVEDAFWRCFLAGGRLEVALRAAGVGRSTGYRWWRAPFLARREQGMTVRAAARELRAPPARARTWEDERRKAAERADRGRDATERRAVRESARHAELLMAGRAPRSDVQARDTRSPDEISGWLRRAHPDDKSRWLCPETIYRALLVPGGQGLHKRYCRKLRTGRRIRKSRWLTRAGHGAVVRNMTMIDQRPAEVETRQPAGHWEGDLIVGTGSASAMMTLRERKTHYGIVVNLPADHTAQTVNAAAIKAFASLPPHMKRTFSSAS